MTLTWKATITEPTSCPDYKPSLNEYTGQVEWPSTHCLVIHLASREVTMEREFPDRASAEAFVSSAPRSCTLFSLDGKAIETRQPLPEPPLVAGEAVAGATLVMNDGTALWTELGRVPIA